MLDNSPQAMPDCPPRPQPVQRTKFDRWLFDCDIDNVAAGKLLNAHPISVGRWRKRYDDPKRQVPPTRVIRDVVSLSDGVVQFEDWDRPCEVAYLTPAADGAGQ